MACSDCGAANEKPCNPGCSCELCQQAKTNKDNETKRRTR